MNIFITDKSPQLSARNLALVHVNKMIQEGVQLLANAHHYEGSPLCPRLCKPSHTNHPCSLWVRSSKEHYLWLVSHVRELINIWREHNGKVHGHNKWFVHLKRNVPTTLLCSVLVVPRAVTSADWGGRNYMEDTFTTYQRYLSWKYDNWQTRVDKKRMPVEFLDSKVPSYYAKYSNLRRHHA
jgi:hypothetical protein